MKRGLSFIITFVLLLGTFQFASANVYANNDSKHDYCYARFIFDGKSELAEVMVKDDCLLVSMDWICKSWVLFILKLP